MKDQTLDTIGKFLTGGERRDAVHFAVAPVISGGFLKRAQQVKFAPGSTEIVVAWHYEGDFIGIIDPFLEASYVPDGKRCWLFMLPNTITGLRHEWTHPAFNTQSAPILAAPDLTGKARSEKWLREFAELYEGDYRGMVAAAISGESYCFGSDIEYEDFYKNAEFWTHIEEVTGKELSTGERESNNNFRCAC